VGATDSIGEILISGYVDNNFVDTKQQGLEAAELAAAESGGSAEQTAKAVNGNQAAISVSRAARARQGGGPCRFSDKLPQNKPRKRWTAIMQQSLGQPSRRARSRQGGGPRRFSDNLPQNNPRKRWTAIMQQSLGQPGRPSAIPPGRRALSLQRQSAAEQSRKRWTAIMQQSLGQPSRRADPAGAAGLVASATICRGAAISRARTAVV
jgi:hypothetical protein